MSFTGLLGGPLSTAGNIVPAFGGSATIGVLTGVQTSSVGSQYDFALGYDNGSGIVNMVGYVLQAAQMWKETTDIQDNDRLIQISSPNSTDRFTFFPKATQSDWSGGERQVIFVDGTRYYSSQKLETGIPGHLFIYGKYADLGAKPANTGAITPSPHNISWNTQTGPGTEAYAGHIACQNGSTNNSIRVSTNVNGATPTLSGEIIGPSGGNLNNVQELLHAPDKVYAALSGGGTPGIYRYNTTSFDHYGTDQVQPTGQVTGPASVGPQMAYLSDQLFYVLNGSSPNQIYHLAYSSSIPGGGSGAGSSVLTMFNQEGTIESIGQDGTGLFFTTMGNVWAGAYGIASFYSWDGVASTGTLLERLPYVILDICQCSGVTFILAVQGTYTQQPVLLAFTQGLLSVFDDYRFLPSDFQSTSAHVIGNLSTDGDNLFVSFPGLSVKRYNLRAYPTVVVSDVGHPEMIADAVAHTHQCSAGAILEVTTAPLFSYASASGPGGSVVPLDSGYLITSYFDMGAPTTAKVWRDIEVELNAALGGGARVDVFYALDNQVGFPNTLNVATLGNNNLIAFFPRGVKSSKIRFKIMLTASSNGTSPDIRSFSVNGRLGRVWTAPTQVRRNLVLQDGSQDQQGGTAKDKLANLLNAYLIAAGQVVLYIPSATAANGVEQVNAVLEDYEYDSPRPGPNFSEQGAVDMEADITLTLVERI